MVERWYSHLLFHEMLDFEKFITQMAVISLNDSPMHQNNEQGIDYNL